MHWSMHDKPLAKSSAVLRIRKSIKSQLQLILCVCTIGVLSAGCCSTHCADCIPLSKMPYTVYDNGVKYSLTDHISINQMIDGQTLVDSIQKHWSETLRQKFPDDKALMAYLDQRQKAIDKIHSTAESKHETHWDALWDMKADLEKTGGEFYSYRRTLNKADSEMEEGYLILSNGKVVKTYVTGTEVREIKHPTPTAH